MAMIDGRKNRKDFVSIVQETYKDFAENTSIHGLKYTVKRGIELYEKLFWIVVVLMGLSGAGYMTALFWNRYRSNPTRTSIMTSYAPNTAVPFPAVTICNINRIMINQVEDFMKRLQMEDEQEEIVRRAFPQLLSFTSTSYRKYNMSELNVLHNVLIDNDYSDIGLVMKKITQPCEEMLVKCMWQFETVPCGDIFEDTLTTDGPCCSFNYIREYIDGNRKPIYTPFNGFNSGLKVLLDPNVQPVQYSSLHSSGLKVIKNKVANDARNRTRSVRFRASCTAALFFLTVIEFYFIEVLVHNPWDYPGSGSIYKIISAGRQSYLQVSASKIVCSEEIRKLSVEQRQCAYPEEVNLKYFRLYGDTNCLTECEERYLFQKCGCVPFYYPFSTRRVCNITSVPCLDESIGTTMVNITKACNCPSQCEDVFYSVLSSTATLGFKEASPTSSFFLDQNITDDGIALYVYFSGQRQTILYKDVITSTIYLLSSFGGVYSLFLGCSFITIVEIIYYCSFRLAVSLKIVGRIDRVRKEKVKHTVQAMQQQSMHVYGGNVFLN